MVYSGARFYCQAECGENIYDFAKEIVEFRKTKHRDLIVKFNHIYIEVDDTMTAEDVINEYRSNFK